jgi:CRISPR-associated endoribonuclease Cas6
MPLSAVIQLEALADAQLDQFTGRGVHGFWFKHWKQVDAAFADELHATTNNTPFTLSPLMGLPRPGRGGLVSLRAGQPAWFRFTALTDALAESARSKWLPGLEVGSRIEVPSEREDRGQAIAGLGWKVTGVGDPSHSFFGEAVYEPMGRGRLMNSNPPRQWRLEFLTPTTFNSGRTPEGRDNHLPFPLPESLIGSWLRRWQAFSPLSLPEEELGQWARTHLAVSAYQLRTVPAREGERLRVGCVGSFTLRALDMPPYLRGAVDLLAEYAFFCGSGAHTAQGLGQTKLTDRQ